MEPTGRITCRRPMTSSLVFRTGSRRTALQRLPAVARRRNRGALPQRDVHRRLSAQPGRAAAQQRYAPGADPHPEPGPPREKIPGSARGRVLDALADPGESGALHGARSETRAADSLLRRQLIPLAYSFSFWELPW